MAQLIVPADAATLTIQHLDARLDIPVKGKGTANTGLFVQVRDTGGNPRDEAGAVNEHQITVTVWGANAAAELDALEHAGKALAQLRLAELTGWLHNTPCTAVRILSLPYFDPDPATARARYTFTCRLHLRATATTI